MKNNLAIEPQHLKILQKILQILPPDAQVWVFGSRITSPRPYSDLDLLIDLNGQALPTQLRLDLQEKFSESDLPYKVDIVDWNAIDSTFKQVIADKKILLKY